MQRQVPKRFFVLKKCCTKKTKEVLQNPPPKTGLQHPRLLLGSSFAHKAHLVTDFLESEKIIVQPYPPSSQNCPPATILCFKNSKYHLERDSTQEIPLGLQFISIRMGFPIDEYENCFQKWIDWLIGGHINDI